MKLAEKNLDLTGLDEEVWESLCGHCGVCCLHKIIDVETGDICTTNVVCEFYDLESGRCSVYHKRFSFNSGCMKITPDNISELLWLPHWCGYRRFYEKRSLPAAGKGLPRRSSRLEQVLGCPVVVFREDMNLAEHVVCLQCGG